MRHSTEMVGDDLAERLLKPWRDKWQKLARNHCSWRFHIYFELVQDEKVQINRSWLLHFRSESTFLHFLGMMRRRASMKCPRVIVVNRRAVIWLEQTILAFPSFIQDCTRRSCPVLTVLTSSFDLFTWSNRSYRVHIKLWFVREHKIQINRSWNAHL